MPQEAEGLGEILYCEIYDKHENGSRLVETIRRGTPEEGDVQSYQYMDEDELRALSEEMATTVWRFPAQA